MRCQPFDTLKWCRQGSTSPEALSKATLAFAAGRHHSEPRTLHCSLQDISITIIERPADRQLPSVANLRRLPSFHRPCASAYWFGSMTTQQQALQPPAVERMQTYGLQPGIQDPAKPFTLCVALMRTIKRERCSQHHGSCPPLPAACCRHLPVPSLTDRAQTYPAALGV